MRAMGITWKECLLTVESQKSKWTTFTIELPLTTQGGTVLEEKEVVAKTRRLGRQKTNGRILVVDDEPAVCEVLARALSEEGYLTDSAVSAKAALEKTAGNNYELCSIDLEMPWPSGRDLYEIMKQRYPSSAEKVVFITGDTITPAAQNFLALAGKPCPAKLFDSKQVVELIEETLGGG